MTPPSDPWQLVAELEARLREAQETLDAIRQGEIDAVVMQGSRGHRVYTLETADRPYRMLVERMQEGAVTLSDAGVILYCNPYFAGLLRRPLEQLTGQTLLQHVNPADQAGFIRLMAADPAERQALEMVLVAQGGREIAVNVSLAEMPSEPGSPRMNCVVITDLTQLRLRARELRETVQRLREETAVREAAERDRERLALLVEESSEFIGLADLDGRSLYVNTAGRKLVGLTWPLIAQGLHVRDFLMPEDHDRFARVILPAALRDGRWSGETQFRHFETGAAITVAQDVFVLMNKGKPANFATIARNLTEQKRIEGQLRQAQKMEAVGQLTGGIAHDFNNLLTGILGSLELMQARLAQGRFDSLDRYANAAVGSAQRAAAMTQRLLAFSRRQPLTPRAMDANALVDSMEDLLRRTIGPGITLTIMPGAALWPTMCDSNQLENVLLNLVINARDAMPQGGEIEICCCNLDASEPDVARARDVPPRAYVVVGVRDTGTGMAPDVAARAFDPFFTTKPMGQGTGLGLSMVYGFAKQSDGHVRLESEVGAGTTVWLYLPRSVVAVEAPPVSLKALVEPARVAGETVLVVEDEHAIRQMVIEVLGEMGLKTMEAANGPDALNTLQSQARIDLLVTDVGLPGLDGRQLVEAARNGRPDLKVLFMTGYAEDPMFRSLEAKGRSQMITKPFAMEALRTRVREMIRL